MINKKIASELAVGTVLILAIAVGGIFWMENKNSVISDQSLVIQKSQKPEIVNIPEIELKNEVACTMEAKLCDDGSSVGRTGPNCEFAECPIANVLIKQRGNGNFAIDNVWFDLPENLIVAGIQGSALSIKDLNYKTKYEVNLTLNRIRKYPLNGSGYENEENRFNNFSIKGGSVFQIRAGGAFMVTGLIIYESYYQFDWAVESNQPIPENLDGPWLAESSFTQERVMDIMKSAYVE